ncbi:MAG TPA: STAS domain-containing protein [Streptosporangiaceae bacterium]|nr:STAS domain-containing protein [Streptosporangiaceae bacterium]
MNDAAARRTDRAFTLSLQRAGRETLLVALSGKLAIEHVEELAACADQVCGLPVRNVRPELSGLMAVDGPGARTLAAACQCLRLNGHRVYVRGVRREVSLVLDQLALVRPTAGPAGSGQEYSGEVRPAGYLPCPVQRQVQRWVSRQYHRTSTQAGPPSATMSEVG